MKRLSIYLLGLFIFYNSSLLAYSSNPKELVSELVNEEYQNYQIKT